MTHPKINFLRAYEEEDDIILAHQGRLEKRHHHEAPVKNPTAFQSLWDLVMTFKNDTTSGFINIMRSTVQATMLGIGLTPVLYAFDVEYYANRNSALKLDYMYKNASLKVFNIFFRRMSRYYFAFALMGFSYGCIYIQTINNWDIASNEIKMILGHTVWGASLSLIFGLHNYARCILGGFVIGFWMMERTWRYTKLEEPGIIYLPSTDPEILEARKKAEEREIIHALSLSMMMRKFRPDLMGTGFGKKEE